MWLLDLLKDRKKTEAVPHKESSRTLKKETVSVVGTSYCMDSIKKLYCSNPDWKKNRSALSLTDNEVKKIFRYNFICKPVYLIPEPDNKHDKNAIFVRVAGEKVGYISRDDNTYVGRILKRDVKYVSAYIRGGEYKLVSKTGIIEKGEDEISIKISIGYV